MIPRGSWLGSPASPLTARVLAHASWRDRGRRLQARGQCWIRSGTGTSGRGSTVSRGFSVVKRSDPPWTDYPATAAHLSFCGPSTGAPWWSSANDSASPRRWRPSGFGGGADSCAPEPALSRSASNLGRHCAALVSPCRVSRPCPRCVDPGAPVDHLTRGSQALLVPRRARIRCGIDPNVQRVDQRRVCLRPCRRRHSAAAAGRWWGDTHAPEHGKGASNARPCLDAV
jgi:hypothetical protein